MDVRRVAILLGTSGAAGRLTLRGIGAYARTRQDWNCQFQPASDESIDRLSSWQPHGVILEIYSPEWVPKLQALGVPVVDVSEVIEKPPFPLVIHDSHAIGRLAADYLLARGFGALAFIGITNAVYSAVRKQGFVERATEVGVECLCHIVGLASRSNDQSGGHDWRVEDDALRTFIRRLPDRPVGVFASNDGRAIQFIEAGREIGLDVPGRVAVVGCDNDDLLCELARPPLSSVVNASEQVGFQAAAVLNRLLDGQPPAQRKTLLPPINVITRQSSELMAVDDPELAVALRYIRENSHRPLNGDEVVRQVAVARRSLERRFASHLGRTLHDEIERAHVDQARQLLVHTDLPMPAVAERSGFGSLRTLAIAFRKATQLTPSAYRRKHRLR